MLLIKYQVYVRIKASLHKIIFKQYTHAKFITCLKNHIQMDF